MPTKKPSKSVKKPVKSAAKKTAAPKTAGARKVAKPAAGPSKPKAKPVKSVAKPTVKAPVKTPPKPKNLKSAPSTPPKAAPATPAVATPKPAPRKSETSAVPIKFDPRPLFLRPAAEEETDADAATPSSLLAGPRNVKPYITKRGEQYMNKEQLEHFGQILQSWKRDLMVEVDRTVLHMKDEAANFPDPNDRATQEEEFSLELRTRDRERKLIRKIDEALKRIEDGSYGYCLETGEEIGIKRLEARPVATLSVEAQERRERREKQYGDRDDRYR
ncbi:MAG: RNA polymerase-binding protein DksA [Proteobacteria bacterium]|nr:RNA polymerase-binding protein DksA [Pseudomonadota bacterium]